MNINRLVALFLILNLYSCKKELLGNPTNNSVPSKILKSWISYPGRKEMLKKLGDKKFTSQATGTILHLNPTKTFQTIDGFGFFLSGSSANMFESLPAKEETDILHELFGQNENSIGISVLRISIGASDMDETIFSYSDSQDSLLTNFSLEKDKKHLIPLLKKILAINPELKIFAAPWSPPSWMKSNNGTMGGELLPRYYATYANYFVKYIQEMHDNGIEIYALSPQNEPLHPGNNPSMYMPASTQKEFIKNFLGPAFEKNSINTKLIIYDHNCDKPEYPLEILNDAEANSYVFGSAFHLYNGNADAMGLVKEAHPDKEIFFTEQWTGIKGDFAGDFDWHIKNVVLGSLNNYSRTAIEWIISSDPELKMHAPGGCTECLGALTIGNTVEKRNQGYYIIAQASKFIPANSIRIASSKLGNLNNVAVLRPDGKIALIIQNDSIQDEMISIELNNQYVNIQIPAHTVSSHIIE